MFERTFHIFLPALRRLLILGLAVGVTPAAEAAPAVQRLSDSGNLAGKVSLISVALANGQIVTSVKDGAGNLKLISWDVPPGGSPVTRLGESGSNAAGTVSSITSTYLGNGKLVTPVRDGSGNLKLITWDVPAGNAPIPRLADSGNQAGASSVIASVLLGSGRVATPVRDGAGNFKLITWQIPMNGGAVTRLGDSGNQAGKISLVDAVDLGGGRIVTPCANGSGNLLLITWQVSDDGKTITRLADSANQAGAISGLAASYTGFGRVMTSVRDGSGNLKLIHWQISDDGKTITRLADSGSQAGKVGLVSSTYLGNLQLITAVQDGSSNLKVIAWQISADGKTITRLADSAGLAGKVGLLSTTSLANGKIVTAVQDAASNLKLIVWELTGATAAVRTRRNINALSATDLAVLRSGVAKMRGRKEWDPTSWLYQANIHGTPAGTAQPGWNTCNHGSWYFPPWHRMEIFYLEKLVRDASGDPNFNQPFWNYTDSNNRQIPSPYRTPADASNALWITQRSPAMNAGGSLPPGSVSITNAYQATNFSSPAGSGDSFGGQRSGPVHGLRPHSRFESTPHDAVHGDIGGFMLSLETAAQDPVFWLHHTNIDRLWEGWLKQGGGRSNPTPPQGTPWLGQRFEFYDSDRRGFVSLSGAEIVSTASQLGYVYSELPPVMMFAAAVGPPSPAPEAAPAAPRVLAEKELPEMQLRGQRESTSLRIAAVEPESVQGGLTLSIEGVEVSELPVGHYEVYVNLPEGEAPNFESAYFVGNLSFFGLDHEGEGHEHKPAVFTYALDDVARRLREIGQWSEDLRVTFVKVGPIPPPGFAQPEAAEPPVRIRKIRLLRLPR